VSSNGAGRRAEAPMAASEYGQAIPNTPSITAQNASARK
jgi:hypothetical protein